MSAAMYTPPGWLAPWQTQTVDVPQFAVVNAERRSGVVSVQAQDDLVVDPGAIENLLVLDGDQAQPSPSADGGLAYRYADGNWSVRLSGQANDPAVGVRPGSGLAPASLEILMDGKSNGGPMGWQPPSAFDAEIGWQLDYSLPEAAGDPTDAYTITMRARDYVGNLTEG